MFLFHKFNSQGGANFVLNQEETEDFEKDINTLVDFHLE